MPVARDTFGTSHYRDGFTHRTGKGRHHVYEDGDLAEVTTSARRVFTSRSAQDGQPGQGYHPGRSASAHLGELLRDRPEPGLTDRERISGRSTHARKSNPKYFTLSYTPRAYSSQFNTRRRVSV